MELFTLNRDEQIRLSFKTHTCRINIMYRGSDKRLLVILALLLAIAPFQTVMSGFADMSDQGPAPSMIMDMDFTDHGPQGCNSGNCCDSHDCTSDSCSLCSAATALIPGFSLTQSSSGTVHERYSDTGILHWMTSPPFRPPWS